MSEDADLASFQRATLKSWDGPGYEANSPPPPTKIQGGNNLGGAFGHIDNHNNIKVKSVLKDCIANLYASCMLGGGMV